MKRALALLAAAALLLVACRSGDDGEVEEDADDATTAPPRGDVETPDMPTTEGPVTGPGSPYIDPLEAGFPPGDQAADSGYVFEEYIASGTAAGEPYRVRVQVARPGDDAATPFSGHAIVEAIHPQGIPFVWNFTRDYLMAQGHAAVNVSVFPNTVETLRAANAERYGDLHVVTDEANANSSIAFDHASDIYAQVGLWLKSEQTAFAGGEVAVPDGPLDVSGTGLAGHEQPPRPAPSGRRRPDLRRVLPGDHPHREPDGPVPGGGRADVADQLRARGRGRGGDRQGPQGERFPGVLLDRGHPWAGAGRDHDEVWVGLVEEGGDLGGIGGVPFVAGGEAWVPAAMRAVAVAWPTPLVPPMTRALRMLMAVLRDGSVMGVTVRSKPLGRR